MKLQTISDKLETSFGDKISLEYKQFVFSEDNIEFIPTFYSILDLTDETRHKNNQIAISIHSQSTTDGVNGPDFEHTVMAIYDKKSDKWSFSTTDLLIGIDTQDDIDYINTFKYEDSFLNVLKNSIKLTISID